MGSTGELHQSDHRRRRGDARPRQGPALTPAAKAEPRSIADVVRALDHAGLVELLRLRPDLAQPRPQSLSEVSERSGTAASTRAAVDALDSFQRRVCHGLAACPEPISVRHLARLVQADPGATTAAVSDLRKRALVWGTDRQLRVTGAARACFGSYPAGLAGTSPQPLSEAEIAQRLRLLDDDSLSLIDDLLWSSPIGRVVNADKVVTAEQATTPLQHLLAAKLLRPLDGETVIVPREVSLHRRGGRLFEQRVGERVPGWPGGEPDRISEAAGLGTAVQLTHTLATVIDELDRMHPRPLATGAISRRDTQALARAVGLENQTQAVVFGLQLARQLGLISHTPLAWAPTTTFDTWLQMPAFDRWRSLVRAWLDLAGWPLAASAQAGISTHPGAERGRLAAAAELRAASPGAAIDPDLLLARLRWRHPTWSTVETSQAATQTLAEATVVGLCALGRSTSLWQAETDPGFPEAGDRFIVQSDLTAVSPGPLTPAVQRMVDLISDRESPGPAAVHRFTAGSLRRAFDAGWTPDHLLTWLGEHATTAIPQPLRYLVQDAARAHGGIRVASVAALITIDDQATLAALLRHPQAASLGLRQISPTGLVATAEAAEVVELLREWGQAPVAEAADGGVVPTPTTRRLRPPAEPVRPMSASRDQLAQLAHDLLAPSQSAEVAVAADQMLSALVTAQSAGAWVQISHVDANGRRSRSRVKVLAVAQGQARVVERGTGQRVLPLSRIVAVSP